MSDMYEKIKELEISLHQPEVRRNKDALNSLLHASFKEIGYSGKTYDLNTILEALHSEEIFELGSTIWSQSYEFVSHSDCLVQVIYLSAQVNNGSLSRHAKRTSIWVNELGAWKMKYHQATPTSSFEIICA